MALKTGKETREKCPVCGKPVSAEARPFCSSRCRDVDLNRWLSGGYRIETDEEPKEGDPENNSNNP